MIPLADQIACVENEIALMERNCAAWLPEGSWPMRKREIDIQHMKAVLETLREVERAGQPEPPKPDMTLQERIDMLTDEQTLLTQESRRVAKEIEKCYYLIEEQFRGEE